MKDRILVYITSDTRLNPKDANAGQQFFKSVGWPAEFVSCSGIILNLHQGAGLVIADRDALDDRKYHGDQIREMANGGWDSSPLRSSSARDIVAACVKGGVRRLVVYEKMRDQLNSQVEIVEDSEQMSLSLQMVKVASRMTKEVCCPPGRGCWYCGQTGKVLTVDWQALYEFVCKKGGTIE